MYDKDLHSLGQEEENVLLTHYCYADIKSIFVILKSVQVFH